MWNQTITALLLAGLLFLWAARVLIMALRGPRTTGGQALCAGCGYPVEHPIPEACPECGKDLLKVGIVTPWQRRPRSSMARALLAWTLIAGIIGLPLGSYAYSRLHQSRYRAAVALAAATQTVNRTEQLAYRLRVDARGIDPTRVFDMVIDHQSTRTTASGQKSSDLIQIAILGGGSSASPSAVITADLVSGTLTYQKADGTERGSTGADATLIEDVLASTPVGWKEGEAKAHAAALKAMLEGAAAGSVRLEPVYQAAGLRVPQCYSSRSGTSSSSGRAPTGPVVSRQIELLLRFGVPSALATIGWLVIPLRMRWVRRREDEDMHIDAGKTGG